MEPDTTTPKADEKITVLRIKTDAGVFFTKLEGAPALDFENAAFRGYEHVYMTQAEYEDIPVTEDSKRFFAGKRIGARSE